MFEGAKRSAQVWEVDFVADTNCIISLIRSCNLNFKSVCCSAPWINQKKSRASQGSCRPCLGIKISNGDKPSEMKFASRLWNDNGFWFLCSRHRWFYSDLVCQCTPLVTHYSTVVMPMQTLIHKPKSALGRPKGPAVLKRRARRLAGNCDAKIAQNTGASLVGRNTGLKASVANFFSPS